MKPSIPKVITHTNMQPVLDAIADLACYQCVPGACDLPVPDWVHQPVTLEVPIGELCGPGLKTLAIIGRSPWLSMDLTGREGFNAQGLEGKAQIQKDLLSALFNLRDLIPVHRGRILVHRKENKQ